MPATKGLVNPENFPVEFVMGKAALGCTLNYCMSNSFGFGGTNSCLIFKKINKLTDSS